MKQLHDKRIAFEEKAKKERQTLSQEHLISTVSMLEEALRKIESQDIPPPKKLKEKLALIRVQINIRKKVYNQKVNIPITSRGKQRSLKVIIQELSEFITAHEAIVQENAITNSLTGVNDPLSLVGKQIQHRFLLECGKCKWFSGVVIGYNHATKAHEVVYEGETEHQFYDLKDDLKEGDIVIVEN